MYGPEKQNIDQDASSKPGVGDIAIDLGKSFVQSALITPVWNGLGQLVSCGRLPQVTITNEENAKHSTADAWAQKLGGAAGMALDFFILAEVAKGAAVEGVEAQTAKSIGLGGRALARLGEGVKLGATYGTFFVPSAKGDNIALGRLKNAATNGITFGALGGLSEAAGGIGVLGKIQPGTLAHAIKDIGVTGAVGLPSGAIGAEADSLINHRTTASWQNVKEQAVDYGVIGVVFTSLTHGASAMGSVRSASLPASARGSSGLDAGPSAPAAKSTGLPGLPSAAEMRGLAPANLPGASSMRRRAQPAPDLSVQTGTATVKPALDGSTQAHTPNSNATQEGHTQATAGTSKPAPEEPKQAHTLAEKSLPERSAQDHTLAATSTHDGAAEVNALGAKGDPKPPAKGKATEGESGAKKPAVEPMAQRDGMQELAKDRGKPVSSEVHDTMAGRISRTVYRDKTVVENHIDSKIKVTTLADGTRITESQNGVRTEHPDGSETNVTSYRTERRSKEGKWTIEENKWAKGWANWENLNVKEKRTLLKSLDEIPPGGDLAGAIVLKGLGEHNIKLQRLAVQGIEHITNPEEQVTQWSYANNYNPQFNSLLIDMLPKLAQESRERILSGHGTSISGVFEAMAEKRSAANSTDPVGDAAHDYLQLVQGFSKTARKSIWDSLTRSVERPDESINRYLEPFAKRIVEAVKSGDPYAKSTFAEFSNLPRAYFKPIETLQPGKPTRPDIKVNPAETANGTFAKIKDVLLSADGQPEGARKWEAIDKARQEVVMLLKENQSLELRKMLTDWGREQHADWIKDLLDRQMSPSARYLDQVNEFRRLAAKDPELSQRGNNDDDYHLQQVMDSPFALKNRSSEYYVSTDQVEATLQNSLQLMQIADANRGPSGELTRAGQQFRMAALQIMAQAGDPFLVVQGTHPTCALAQLEFSTFLKHPDEASRMINEVMRTGQFVTQDGTIIKVDAQSLRPENGSLEPNPTVDEATQYNYRSYISQLFETVAANIYWQRQTTVPDGTGRQVPPGSLRYEVRFEDAYNKFGRRVGEKSSDHLMDYSRTPPVEISDCPYIYNLHQLVDIGEQIGGARTRPSVTETIPDNEVDFQHYLEFLPYPESFPLILPIDATALQNPGTAFVAPNHAISILTPWQGGQRIYFHNSWEPGSPVQNNIDRSRFWEITNK